MLNVNKMLTKMLKWNYVVEEGTSGGWYYRKWNSGVLEITGRNTFYNLIECYY